MTSALSEGFHQGPGQFSLGERLVEQLADPPGFCRLFGEMAPTHRYEDYRNRRPQTLGRFQQLELCGFGGGEIGEDEIESPGVFYQHRDGPAAASFDDCIETHFFQHLAEELQHHIVTIDDQNSLPHDS